MSGAARPALARLAERLGVAASYHDLSGVERRTSDTTREALCAAQGYASASEAECARALAQLDADEAAAVIEPVALFREHARAGLRLALRPPASQAPLDAELELAREDGSVERCGLRLAAGDGRRSVSLPIPWRVDAGYHELRLRVAAHGGTRTHAQRLVVAPRTAWLSREALGEAQLVGLWANLYTLRSERNWGFGDLTDLVALARLAAVHGAGFIALNPLHALRNRFPGIAPYSPVSRVFQNLLYIDVEAVPELADCAPARARLAELPLAALRAAPELDHARVLDAKLSVLRELQRAFAARERAAPSARGRAFAAYRAEAGAALEDFAAYEVLADRLGEADWRRWPERYREPRSAAVRAFAAQHADELELRAWLQFELDAQLEAAAGAARAAGLTLGFVKDLAVGSAPDSADTWACRELFAEGATLGAPPDAYSADGQNWGLPPLRPRALRADGYGFVRRMLRSAFRGAGALRIDHVMGMMRLFWIPAGRPGSEGTYVRQPLAELLGIVALESRRARALVIGEDLGTVPPELAPELASHGVLSTRVSLFERDGAAFRASSELPARAYVQVTTHDLPPLAGYLAGADLAARRALAPAAEAAASVEPASARAAEREALAAALRAEGLVGPGPVDDAELVRATSAWLARSPARLVALGLDDLAGEREPLHLPGVPVERHRGWCRRMRRELTELAADPLFESALAARHSLGRRGGG